MPVRFAPGGDHHEREEYSFYTRDHGSRDFARSRRFGGKDGDESRTMSLVSTPLQVPLIGNMRGLSPSQKRSPTPPQQRRYDDDYNEEDVQAEVRSMQQRRQPTERRRYEYKEYDDYNDIPLQPLVPTYLPRVGRTGYRGRETRYESMSPRRSQRYQQPQYENEYDEIEYTRSQNQKRQEEEHHEEPIPSQLPSRQQRQDDELQSILNWRKRAPQKPLVHTDFGYVIPPMRKRTDPVMQDEEERFRNVVGYIAKRKQFAVEDDDGMQYYRNPNYTYRMHGPERPLITDKEAEESMERSRMDKAPMFDMKIRSHVVWEKMNVKFTCTVRGSPRPRVTWYKNMVPLEPSLHSAGKYKISNQFGLHTLEINRASTEDSGTYRVSVQNRKGEISSYASLLVRRYDAGRMGVVDVKSGYNMKKPSDYPNVEGMNILGTRSRAGEIEVREYDELPETDAARHFKSQLENLDFDVKKLIKEAKLDKNITKANRMIQNGDVTSNVIDGVMTTIHQPGDSITLDGTTKISKFRTVAGGQKSDATPGYLSGDDTIKIYTSDVSSDGEGGKSKSRFKVAVEINVTNEKRRDSFETFQKVLGQGKKFGAEQGSIEKKAEPEKDQAN